jgi:hypothetical protein
VRRALVVSLAVSALAAAAAIGASASAYGASAVPATSAAPGDADYSWAKRVAAAKRFAAHRQGEAAFAVVDEEGRARAFHPNERFESASVIKVMLMLAYLRQGDVSDRPLTDADKHLLAPMIKRSANEPASAIYEQVGARALYELARKVGMKGFSTNPVWGSSQITALGQAKLLFEVERFIPDRHRSYGMHLLASIIPAQRWGIPAAVPHGFKIHFKGGWAPEAAGWKINQVALMTNGERRISLAVLTRGNPSQGYGHGTVRGVAERLLNGYG